MTGIKIVSVEVVDEKLISKLLEGNYSPEFGSSNAPEGVTSYTSSTLRTPDTHSQETEGIILKNKHLNTSRPDKNKGKA